MKTIKLNNNETFYIIKRSGLFKLKSEVYWVSQGMAIPVVNIGSVLDGGVDTEAETEKAENLRDEMREDGIPTKKN